MYQPSLTIIFVVIVCVFLKKLLDNANKRIASDLLHFCHLKSTKLSRLLPVTIPAFYQIATNQSFAIKSTR